jgi:hypothetical protein
MKRAYLHAVTDVNHILTDHADGSVVSILSSTPWCSFYLFIIMQMAGLVRPPGMYHVMYCFDLSVTS